MSLNGAVLAGSAAHGRGHGRRRGRALHLVGQRELGDLAQLVEAAADHPEVVLDHARAARAEFLLQALAHRVDQPFLVEPMLGEQAGGGKECALEGDALHAQLEVGVGGLLARDAEGVEVAEPDLARRDLAPVALRDVRPGLLGRGRIRLDDEQAAVAQPGERIAVTEHVRVGRKHDIDVVVLAVDADRCRRHREIEGRRLALLLRAVLRVGLDVPAEQVEQRRRQVLAGGDRAPAADRVHAHRHAVAGMRLGFSLPLTTSSGSCG
jgi:hypothetical protein